MGLLTPSSLEAGGRKQKINAYNILILCLLGPASIVYGYAAAIIATTFGQPSFITYFGLDVKTNASSLIGAMSALFFVGGFIGPLCLPPLADRFGRKWSIFASLVLTTIAAAFMAGSTNVGEFIFFRFVSGAGAFMLLAAIPLLMNEVVPSSMRGGLVELHAVFFIAGFMIASWIGFGFSFWTRGGIDAWRPPLAIQAGWSLLAMVALYWVPESPRWLIMKGQEAKAQAILEKLHSDASDPDHEFAKAEFYQIVKQLHIDKTLGNSWMHIIKKPSYRKRAIIAVLLTSFIQSSGDLVINSTSPAQITAKHTPNTTSNIPPPLLTYAPTDYGPILYANLGYSTTKQLLYPSAWLTFTFGISVLAMPLIDRVARNVLVAVGLWGTMCCLIVEAALVAEFVDKAPATADAKPNNNALQAAVAMFFVFQVFDTAMLNGEIPLKPQHPSHHRASLIPSDRTRMGLSRRDLPHAHSRQGHVSRHLLHRLDEYLLYPSGAGGFSECRVEVLRAVYRVDFHRRVCGALLLSGQ